MRRPRRHAPSLGRKIVFSLLMLVLVLGMVEIALRLADAKLRLAADVLPLPQQSSATAQSDLQRLADTPRDCRQPLAIRPPTADLASAVQTPERWLAPQKRADDAPRLFVVGGSAAFGDGVEYAQTFAARLGERVPGQVINAAQNGANSALVATTVKTIVDCHDPTTIILLSGNNEWLDWDFRQPPTWRTKLHEALFASVTYRFAVLGVRKHEVRKRRKKVDEGGADVFAVQQGCEPRRTWRTPRRFDQAAWARLRRERLARFAFYISESIRYAREHDVEVILCTVPFRRRMCPAYFLPQPLLVEGLGEAAVAEAVKVAAQALADGKPSVARDVLADVVKRHPTAPLPLFFAGEAAWASHRSYEASMHFRQARENTVGNLGAMVSINDVLRGLAAREWLPLVDLDRDFSEGQFTEVDGDRLFLDFCHPNAAGHRVIAKKLQKLLEYLAREK